MRMIDWTFGPLMEVYQFFWAFSNWYFQVWLLSSYSAPNHFLLALSFSGPEVPQTFYVQELQNLSLRSSEVFTWKFWVEATILSLRLSSKTDADVSSDRPIWRSTLSSVNHSPIRCWSASNAAWEEGWFFSERGFKEVGVLQSVNFTSEHKIQNHFVV